VFSLRGSSRWGAVVGLALALLALAPAARAHAILVASQPAANAEIVGANVDLDVSLEFNSRIDAARSSLQLAKDGGALQPVALGETEKPNFLVGKAPKLAPGAYRLRWQVLSVDGHVSRGDVNFKVRAP